MANDGDSDPEEDGLENLEAEVAELAQRVADYRATLPRQLMAPLASTLSARRPSFPAVRCDVAESGHFTNRIGAEGAPLVEDLETEKRVQVLKQKISDDISAMPVLLKRMRDVISKVDKQDSCNLVIPPVYKKKRTS